MPRPLISRRWTPEEDQKLAELLRKKKTPLAIAVALRRTLTSVKTRIRKNEGLVRT